VDVARHNSDIHSEPLKRLGKRPTRSRRDPHRNRPTQKRHAHSAQDSNTETPACNQTSEPRPNLVQCFNLVLFASTIVCCAGHPATCYRAAREPPLRADSFTGLEMRARGAQVEKSTKLEHGIKLGRTLCYSLQPHSRLQQPRDPARRPLSQQVDFDPNPPFGAIQFDVLPRSDSGPVPTWGIRGTRNKIRVFYSNLACFCEHSNLEYVRIHVIQGKLGGICDSYSCGCATGIR